MNHKLIDNQYRSAKILDSTIRDQNYILTIRSELNNVHEELQFSCLLDQILTSIEDEVDAANARIEADFSEAPTLTTIRSYAHSIMLNLLTNALKYRSPDRKLHLKIKTFHIPNYICLSISDNGSGIDLVKESDKVFGLYKRFHSHIEGKGLGLHLVKTQAELLGGKVEVESQVSKGSTFRVFFNSKV
jgi:signal transduction histidine kinase